MNSPCTLAVALGAVLFSSVPVAAQGGGFVADDLYVYALIPAAPNFRGIVRVDPLTGAGGVILQNSQFIDSSHQGTMAFDPYRQRLIYMEYVPALSTFQPRLCDAFGQVTPLEPSTVTNNWRAISPTGDGRIYYRDGSLTQFRWIDAANRPHVLTLADGVTPFTNAGFASDIDCMIYHPGENALFIATSWPDASCGGPNQKQIFVRKASLSADGARVIGLACNDFDVNPLDYDFLADMALLPDGDILLGANSGDFSVPLPRLIRVDEVTLAMSTYAAWKDAGNGGIAYSHALGKAIAQDSFDQALLSYFEGQVDGGLGVPSSVVFSDPRAVVKEIPQLACSGGWIAYGPPLAGKAGMLPAVWGSGCPEPGENITLHIEDAVGGAQAVLFLGLGKASIPFRGGSFLIDGLLASLPFPMSGTPGVAGAGDIDLPTSIQPDPLLTGLSIFMQVGFQDAAAVQGVSLTQGLQLEIG